MRPYIQFRVDGDREWVRPEGRGMGLGAAQLNALLFDARPQRVEKEKQLRWV